MKSLLLACLMAATPFFSASWAADPAPGTVAGEVLEVKDVESYTYLRLKTKDGETWAAVPKTALKPGAKVTIGNVMVMTNFESKALKKTFPSILFGTLGASGAAAAGPMVGAAKALPAEPIKVAKATGANARTVAEVVTKAADLNGKQVRVRGKVVKYNPGIMGKNWLHLRDGSGTDADASNDLLVTSTTQAALGDVVTATGTVRTNKDFGAGYSYKVLVEEASLQP